MGNPFFKKNSNELHPREKLKKLPYLTLQLNEILMQPDIIGKPEYTIRTVEKCVIAPNQQATLKCNLKLKIKRLADVCGILEPEKSFQETTVLCITSSLSRTDSQGNLYISALNLQRNEITLPRNPHVAYFKCLSTQQAETVTPIDPQQLPLTKVKKTEDFEHEINQLIIDEEFIADSQPPRQNLTTRSFWFPEPETCNNPTALRGVEKKVYKELQKQKELDSVDPHIHEQYREQFQQRFKWKDSILKKDEKQQVGVLLVEFLAMFAKHRFDVGYNSQLSLKLTPEHDQQVYTQSPPTPIHLREKLQVEIALLQ